MPIEPVARRLLGEPNAALSNGHELRFGARGSLAVDLSKDVFFDHENGEGGGVIDLIKLRETNTDPFEWLRAEGFIERPEIVATYDYTDATGKVLYQAVRFEPKDFRQRHWDAKTNDWDWHYPSSVKQVPYRLPAMLAAPNEPVFVVEGEKDADALAALGLVATTNVGGASKGKQKSKWKPYLSTYFKGRVVYVLPDNDDTGRAHANAVARSLSAVAESVRVVELPDLPTKGDVSDWLAAGNDQHKLLDLCRAAPMFGDGGEAESQSNSGINASAVSVDEAHPHADLEPQIVMQPGDLVAIVSEAERALIAAGTPIYERGGELVRPVRLERSTDNDVKRAAGALMLHSVQTPWLVERMARSAEWCRRNRNGELIPADPAARYATTLLARAGEWNFASLRGVVPAPTLAPDGRIIEQPGFDQQSGLLLNFGHDAFPPVPQKPTKDDAKAALERLDRPLREFPFVSDAAHSVALSALLTALIRGSLRTAPLHAFDAPTAGTGKSLLATMAGLLVAGTRPAAMSQGKTEEEDEKRLSTVLHAGDPVILIDNCERPVHGDFLCAMLTQELVQARILGRSERNILPCTSLVIVTGNNLTLSGDVSRRAVLCRLDAKLERPDQRQFDFDPLVEVQTNRPSLVVDGLTVLRAYALAGRPEKLEPMGSFDDWAWVRGALVWLGRADPAVTREVILAEDPRKADLAEVMDVWERAVGDTPTVVSAISNSDHPDHIALYRALRDIACNGSWSGKRVGWWLKHNANRVVSERYFVRQGQRAWRLVGAEKLRPWRAGDTDGQDEIPF